MLIILARKSNLFDFDFRGIFGDKIAISGHACLPKPDDNSKKLEKLQQNRSILEEFLVTRLPFLAMLVYRNQMTIRRSWRSFNRIGSKFGWERTIFNIGEEYLFLDPTWIADSKELVALQLGSWQDSPRHHIEVDRDDFLTKALRSLKLLKYLSLRGISRISELPAFVLELTNLEILDLKSCHNLETLPDDISALQKLTHLDVSGCYLLDGMPKGRGKLTFLQALKGFIISESRRTPSRIGDLKTLENLKRFSIHIGSEAEIQRGEFQKLEELKALRRLKLSWGVVSKRKKDLVMSEDFKFPPSLEKLVLEGLPGESLPKRLNISKLKGLKKLYIKGGKFNDLGHGDGESGDREWKVEILRLWYMKSTKINESTAEELFPYSKYKPEINHAKEAKANTVISEVEDMEESKKERS